MTYSIGGGGGTGFVSDEYKKGWYDGYQAAKMGQPMINYPAIPMPSHTQPSICNTCGMTFMGAMGWVCSNPSCPTKVTC